MSEINWPLSIAAAILGAALIVRECCLLFIAWDRKRRYWTTEE